MKWNWYEWQALTPNVLHAFLKLRSDIFVVEQDCVFSDMDGLDPHCEHLCGFEGDTLVAYLRLVPPGLKTDIPALGRLVVRASHRRLGHSRHAIEHGLVRSAERFPGQALRAQAQAHLVPFYQSLGFIPQGEEYLEDGIPHRDMLRNPSTVGSLR